MKKQLALIIGALLLLAALGLMVQHRVVAHAHPEQAAAAGQAFTADQLDGLLAPIALYPDQLVAQMLLCATDPEGVKALEQFLKSRPTLKGTELQDAALKDNFQPSFVALALFPQIVNDIARQ